MLFVYSALVIGGIETFFVRMAKERYRLGLKTKILLLRPPHKSNTELLEEIRKYCEVYFVTDIFQGIDVFNRLFPLLAPVRMNRVKALLEGIEQCHAFIGVHVMLAYRLKKLANSRAVVTVGFYHYLRYAWGQGKLPYHERINRQFIFEYLPSSCLLFFSEGNKEFYENFTGKKLNDSRTFRLGVVDKKEVTCSGSLSSVLRLVSIGRLVEFKTYNFFMLDVVRNLIDQGYKVSFDIYGYGPQEEEVAKAIERLELTRQVNLKGALEYSSFDQTVAQYDLFIGSGTAIIQASSLGVPSIVGVENLREPKTYGYFCDVKDLEYNMKINHTQMIDIESLIKDFLALSAEERKALQLKHVSCIEPFTNSQCQRSFDELSEIAMPGNLFRFSRLAYEISWFFDMAHAAINSNHPFSARHRKF